MVQRLRRFVLGGIITLIPSLSLHAQLIPIPHRPSEGIAKTAQPDDGLRKNVVKVNLPSLLLGNLALRYERRFARKLSLQLGVGYIFNDPLGLDFSTLFPDEQTTNLAFDRGSFSGFNVLVEPRWYVFSKRGAPYGFFIAPFGRYYNFTWDIPYDGPDPINPETTIEADGSFSISGYGGGLTMGVQFLLGNRVALDIYGGGGLAISELTGDVRSAEISDPDYYGDIAVDLEQYYDSLPFFVGSELSVTASEGRARALLSGVPFPIARVGFALGVAF